MFLCIANSSLFWWEGETQVRQRVSTVTKTELHFTTKHALRTFALTVPAHPYCARKCTCHIIHEHTPSNKINNDRADGHCIALLGFNGLGRSVTPTFLSTNILFTMIYTLSKNEQKLSVGSWKKFQDFCPRDIESSALFLNHYLCFARKWKNLLIKSLNFFVPGTIKFPFQSYLFYCMTVSNAFSKVKSHKKDGNIRNYLRSRPTCTNVTNIVGLRWLSLGIFNYKPLYTMLNYVRQLF